MATEYPPNGIPRGVDLGSHPACYFTARRALVELSEALQAMHAGYPYLWEIEPWETLEVGLSADLTRIREAVLSHHAYPGGRVLL
jgi:hypothetical protein